MLNLIELAAAGVWKLILDWVLGFGLVGILLFAAFGTTLIAAIPVIGPPLSRALAPIRVDLIWAAVAVTGALVWGAHMQRDEASRCVAKTLVIEKTVGNAVKATTTPRAHKQVDPWDDAKN